MLSELLYSMRPRKAVLRLGNSKNEAQMTEFIQVITSAATKADAQAIATAVVGKRLAACAQVIGPITSTYWWQGNIETAEEWLCIMKSRQDLYDELEQAIRQVHPYKVPEILAIPVVLGSQDYLEWMDHELAQAADGGQ